MGLPNGLSTGNLIQRIFGAVQIEREFQLDRVRWRANLNDSFRCVAVVRDAERKNSVADDSFKRKRILWKRLSMAPTPTICGMSKCQP